MWETSSTMEQSGLIFLSALFALCSACSPDVPQGYPPAMGYAMHHPAAGGYGGPPMPSYGGHTMLSYNKDNQGGGRILPGSGGSGHSKGYGTSQSGYGGRPSSQGGGSSHSSYGTSFGGYEKASGGYGKSSSSGYAKQGGGGGGSYGKSSSYGGGNSYRKRFSDFRGSELNQVEKEVGRVLEPREETRRIEEIKQRNHYYRLSFGTQEFFTASMYRCNHYYRLSFGTQEFFTASMYRCGSEVTSSIWLGSQRPTTSLNSGIKGLWSDALQTLHNLAENGCPMCLDLAGDLKLENITRHTDGNARVNTILTSVMPEFVVAPLVRSMMRYAPSGLTLIEISELDSKPRSRCEKYEDQQLIMRDFTPGTSPAGTKV